MELSQPRSLTIQTGVGRLESGYYLAAHLQDCLLERKDDVLANRISHVTATILWADQYWVHQPVRLVLCFPEAEWCWEEATIGGDLYPSGKIQGTVGGDPIVKPSRVPFYV